MAVKRQQLKIRPTYRVHTEEQYREAIRAAMPEGSILFDYFCDVRYSDVEGRDEYHRGIVEGMRALARDLLEIAVQRSIRVETEQDEENDAATR